MELLSLGLVFVVLRNVLIGTVAFVKSRNMLLSDRVGSWVRKVMAPLFQVLQTHPSGLVDF